MKKTAMQELSEQLADKKDEHQFNTEYDNGVRRGLAIAIVKATQLLEKERLQIEVAHANGIHDAAMCIDGETLKTPKQYFNETYKK